MDKKNSKKVITPRQNHLTPDDINSLVDKVRYSILPSGKTMMCEMTLINGFTLLGEYSCVNLVNFDEVTGKSISYEDAWKKIWPLESYLMQQKTYEEIKK